MPGTYGTSSFGVNERSSKFETDLTWPSTHLSKFKAKAAHAVCFSRAYDQLCSCYHLSMSRTVALGYNRVDRTPPLTIILNGGFISSAEAQPVSTTSFREPKSGALFFGVFITCKPPSDASYPFWASYVSVPSEAFSLYAGVMPPLVIFASLETGEYSSDQHSIDGKKQIRKQCCGKR